MKFKLNTLFEKVFPIAKKEIPPYEGFGTGQINQELLGRIDHTSLPKNRRERYKLFDKMDSDEIEFALDIIADSVASKDEFGHIINFELDDTNTEYDSTIIHDEWEDFEQILELDNNIWELVRDTCKFGDTFYELSFDNTNLENNDGYIGIQKLPSETMSIVVTPENKIIGYDQDIEINNNNQSSKSVFNQAKLKKINSTSKYGHFSNNGDIKYIEDGETPLFSPEQILHFKISGYFYGKSILERVIKTWMALRRMEDSMVIYRIVRAPERRIFYIPTGRLPATQADEYIEKVKQKFNKRKLLKNMGANNFTAILELDIESAQEDYFMPVRSDGGGAKVETLPAGQNLGEIDDIIYWKEKLFSALKIPPSYLSGDTLYNDGKVGVALQREVKFAKYIERIQQKICTTIKEKFENHLLLKGYDTEQINFNLFMTPPSSYKQTAMAEVQSVLLNNYSTAIGNEFISKMYAMKKFLLWKDDEIRENLKMLIREQNAIKIDPNDPDGTTKLDLNILFPDENTKKQIKLCFAKGKPKIDSLVTKYMDDINKNPNDINKKEPLP